MAQPLLPAVLSVMFLVVKIKRAFSFACSIAICVRFKRSLSLNEEQNHILKWKSGQSFNKIINKQMKLPREVTGASYRFCIPSSFLQGTFHGIGTMFTVLWGNSTIPHLGETSSKMLSKILGSRMCAPWRLGSWCVLMTSGASALSMLAQVDVHIDREPPIHKYLCVSEQIHLLWQTRA
jgi:hypothetical protein